MAKQKSSLDRTTVSINVAVQVLAILVIVVMVNYLAFNHYQRWDFSRDQKYSLAEQTKRLVSKLKQPVQFIVFFSGDSDIYRDLEILLKEYVHEGKKNVKVEFVDPYMNLTRAREVAAKYKLGTNENVVVIDFDGRSKVINASTMAEYEPSFNPMEKPELLAFKGEQALTSGLIEITEREANKIYYLTGHGETTVDKESLSGLKTFVQRQNIGLEELKLTDVDGVPSDAKALFIIGARYDFSERDIQLLRAYWEKRGRIFALLDPTANTPRFLEFLNEQGVTVNNDRVLRTVPMGQITGVLKEITGDFVSGTTITKRLKNVNATFLGVTQSLTLDSERVKPQNIQVAPLIRASKGFWAEKLYENSGGRGIFFNPKEDVASPVVAAVVEKGGLGDERVQLDSARILVVGNSTFVSNEAMTEADLDFFLSGMNWLLERDQLMGITPKEVRQFSLHLTQAQMSYLAGIILIAIPCTAGILGVLSWFRRRR
jgi:ABC-type uncharacterized transport system involved in gliding motility auxiliary subunit